MCQTGQIKKNSIVTYNGKRYVVKTIVVDEEISGTCSVELFPINDEVVKVGLNDFVKELELEKK